jgi:SpoVK/Ycf46/Vps4 family AAA+-type ATPase
MDNERNKNILMLGATNKPSRIDGAPRRRFDSGHFHIPLPNEEARESLIKYKIENNHGRGNDLGPDDINYFVRRTENHSMSDITAIVNNLNKVITDEIPDARLKSTRIDPESLRERIWTRYLAAILQRLIWKMCVCVINTKGINRYRQKRHRVCEKTWNTINYIIRNI